MHCNILKPTKHVEITLSVHTKKKGGGGEGGKDIKTIPRCGSLAVLSFSCLGKCFSGSTDVCEELGHPGKMSAFLFPSLNALKDICADPEVPRRMQITAVECTQLSLQLRT